MKKTASRLCPKCKSKKLVPIVYGYPLPETQKKADEGRVVPGGCLIYGDERDPQWHCTQCGHQWR